MSTKDKVIIENVSRRVHIIAGKPLAPTEAAEFPRSVMENGGVAIAFDSLELKEGEEVKAPIATQEEAEKEMENRAKARAGRAPTASHDSNGAPAAKVNAGK